MSSTSRSVSTNSSSTPAPSSTSSSPFTSSAIVPSGGPVDGNNGETRVLDDSDPSILYWTPAGAPATWIATSNTNAYNQTIHQTSCNICAATLLFNGTGLSLTSVISPSGSSFLAILDGNATGPFQLYNPLDSTAVVYAIERLPNAQHNVTFIKSSNDASDQTLFNIDSLTIISRPGTSIGGSASSASPTASGRSTIPQTQTGSSPSGSPLPNTQASSPPPIGAIVGGTVGGVLVIAVIVAWWVLVHRKRSRSKTTDPRQRPLMSAPARRY